jgi:hypothetical protein
MARKSVMEKIKDFCEANKIEFEYENDDGAECLTIDIAINSYVFVYKKPSGRTSIVIRTDWNGDWNYTNSRRSHTDLINELESRFLR